MRKVNVSHRIASNRCTFDAVITRLDIDQRTVLTVRVDCLILKRCNLVCTGCCTLMQSTTTNRSCRGLLQYPFKDGQLDSFAPAG